MPYVDLAGLSRFDGKLKDFAISECAGPDMANWQRTAAAGAVSFSPVPEMPLDPVVNFLFTETGPASGTKSPDNPSTITGVSEVKVTRCGKNLLTRNPVSSVMSQRGITVTYNGDGSIHLKGTAISGYDAYMTYFSDASLGVVPAVMAAGKIFTVSITCSDNNVSGKIYDSNSLVAWGAPVNVSPGTPVTYTMQSDVKSAMFRIMVTRGSTVDCDVHCQIEYGQTATEWEAPADADYTIDLGGTYYGGSVDLSTGVMTVTHGLLELNENTGYSTGAGVSEYESFYRLTVYPTPSRSNSNIASRCVCNIFPVVSSNTSAISCIRVGNNSWAVNVDIEKSLLGLGDGENFNTVKTAYNSFFVSHPGVFVYPVDIPTTVTLTPTQIYSLSQPDPYTPRTNTVYSDQQSVQVGYPKSPQATQNELTSAIVSLGGNL